MHRNGHPLLVHTTSRVSEEEENKATRVDGDGLGKLAASPFTGERGGRELSYELGEYSRNAVRSNHGREVGREVIYPPTHCLIYSPPPLSAISSDHQLLSPINTSHHPRP